MNDASYSHAIAQLYGAVSALVGHGDLRGRLWAKASHNLVTLYPRHMPEELQEAYESLRNAFTWVPVETPGEGRLLSTLRAMSDDEAERVAEKIVELFYRTLEAAYARREDAD